VTTMIRVELDRALGAVGLAKAEDVEALTAKVRDLEAQLRAARGEQTPAAVLESTEAAAASARHERDEARAAVAGAPVAATPAPNADLVKPAKKAVAKKAVAKKAVAKKAAPNGAVVKKAVAKKAAASRSAGAVDAVPPAKKAAKKARPSTPGDTTPTP
jgi:hypothetical protein